MVESCIIETLCTIYILGQSLKLAMVPQVLSDLCVREGQGPHSPTGV